MQRVLLIFLLFSIRCKVNGQDTEHHKIHLNASVGYAFYTTYDPMLNYYNYSGHSFLPVSLSGDYGSNKNLLLISLFNSNSKIHPQNMDDNLYAYNYIKQWNAGFGMEYYRKIKQIHEFIEIYAGISNNASIILQEEFYNNLLFEYGEGYRKSYNLSLLDLSPQVLVQLVYSKSYLRIKSGYTLLNFGMRPDDNFVKQFGVSYSSVWKFTTPQKHTGIQFSISYQYNFWERAGITAEYNFLYHSYSSPDGFKYLRMLFLLGFNKWF